MSGNGVKDSAKVTRGKFTELILTAPSFIWLMVFFIVPGIMVVIISFRNADPWGNIAQGWTLSSYLNLGISTYGPIIWRTLVLSLYTTAICLAVGIPVAYAMARMPKRMQQNILLLLIVPFWTNFLIRIYAWKVLLHPDGLLKQALVALGMIQPEATLLYTEGAVLLVLVYTYLPFAILPLYSSAEKFDFNLLEASRDLGAGPVRSFIRIFLPGISAGIISAIMVVFIPALGSYIIPDIVGGPSSEMLGNKIAQRVFVDRNLPRASALSSLLILVILLPSLVSLRPGRNSSGVTTGRHLL